MGDYKEIIVKEYHNEKGLITRREIGEEIVRCKDCIHARFKSMSVLRRSAYCSLLDRTIKNDGSGYCYFAERKSEEQEHE